jgi:hypothetical protein
MSYQTDNTSKWETAFGEGLVWACIAFPASLVIFLMLWWLSQAFDLEIYILSCLFYPAKIISEYLIARQILCNENIFGYLLIAVSAPWMVIGFIFGACRGFFFKPSAMAERDGCLKTSFYVVLAAIIGVVLIFVY